MAARSTMSAARLLLLAVVLAASGSARLAYAQARADTPAAEAMFVQGRDAMQAGRLDEACERFRESYRLDPAGAGALLNLGVCEHERGHLAAAWEALREGLTRLPPGDPRVAPTRDRLAAVERDLPRITVDLAPDAPKGSRVFRDDLELQGPALGSPLPLDIGTHHVRVEAPGFLPSDVEVSVGKGERTQIVAHPGARIVSPPTPADDRAERPHGLRPVPTVLFIAAGVLVVAGGTFGGLTLDAGNRVHRECDASGACSPAGMNAVSDARTWGTLSTVSFIGAGTALAAGVLLQLLAPSHATATGGAR